MLWFVNKAFYFKGCRLSYLLTSLTAYHEPEPSNENNMPCSFKLIQDTLQPPQEEAPCPTSSAAESCPFSPCPSLPGGVLGLSPACLHGSGGATAPSLLLCHYFPKQGLAPSPASSAKPGLVSPPHFETWGGTGIAGGSRPAGDRKGIPPQTKSLNEQANLFFIFHCLGQAFHRVI